MDDNDPNFEIVTQISCNKGFNPGVRIKYFTLALNYFGNYFGLYMALDGNF